ncbi:MAG: hypothetical protein MJY93_05145 [Fibrobacter sp.]|nr:hypothetical protein [Fibrobacter sp.]
MNKVLFSVMAFSAFALMSCAGSAPEKPATMDAATADAVRNSADASYSEVPNDTPAAKELDAEKPPVAAGGTVEAAPEEPTIQLSNVAFKVAPTVLVAPALTGKMNPNIDVVRKNPLAKTAMEVINAYLTGRDYNVVGLESQAQLDEVVSLQSAIAGNDEDLAYAAGLTVGADINITYSGSIQENDIVIDLNASEASTAQLLGSESVRMSTAGSESQRALVQKAMEKAIVGLENKIRAKLAAQMEMGVQYKVIAHLVGQFTDDQAEEISNIVSMQIRKKFSKMVVNSMSRNTYDLMVFADPEKHEDAQMVYGEFYESLSGFAKVRKQNITKKLIILEIQ